MTFLADLSWPQAADHRSAILAVPIGSTEQHGPHLPMSTDTDIAVALTERLATARPDVVVAPAIAYGSSGEHAGFAGTISIGQQALEFLLLELGRSAALSFARTLFVSAHGGNAQPVLRATRQLRAESRDASAWLPRWDGDAHAGRAETALQLALTPDRVDLASAGPGNPRPIGELMAELRAGGVAAVSRNGVLGDPTGASASEGADLLAQLLADLVDSVEKWTGA